MQGKIQDNSNPLVNVIVPVYKVEAYLEECLNSILQQTWRNLDVILVDDGSPDTCGTICDCYAEKDARVRVFHTENRGLSAARNLGIQKAIETDSKYLVFIDSDDWLENDMIEKLVLAALTTGSDIVVCGEYNEYPGRKTAEKPEQAVCSGADAARAIMSGKMHTKVMIRIWKKELFEIIRFPEGRVYEDAATTHRVYLESDRTAAIPDLLYHYRIRAGSIVHTNSIRNNFDLWCALRERYDCSCWYPLFKEDEQLQKECRRLCLGAAGRLWRNYYDSPKEERNLYKQNIREISEYVKNNFPLFGEKGWRLRFRVYALLTRSASPISFGLAYVLNKLWLLLGNGRKQLFEEGTVT